MSGSTAGTRGSTVLWRGSTAGAHGSTAPLESQYHGPQAKYRSFAVVGADVIFYIRATAVVPHPLRGSTVRGLAQLPGSSTTPLR